MTDMTLPSFYTGRLQNLRKHRLGLSQFSLPQRFHLLTSLLTAINGAYRKNENLIRMHQTSQGTSISIIHPAAAQHLTVKTTWEI